MISLHLKDSFGNLVSTRKGILALYKKEYIQRLAHKPPLPQYKEGQVLQEHLFEKRLDISRLIKSLSWNAEDITKVCHSLKNGKSRDRDGLVYELFKSNYAGPDLIRSLTKLFNKIKESAVIPEFMQMATIISFFKNKGSVQ